MPQSSVRLGFRPTSSFILLIGLLAVLWLAGGASRAEVLGQSIVRFAAILALIVAILAGERPRWGAAKPVGWFLIGIVGLVVLQLIPLPPSVWQALPERDVFVQAATLSGQPQPWRPLAIVPGAAMNAAASMVVPAAVLLLVAQLGVDERGRLPGLLTAIMGASMLIGLLQFSGATFDNPLINDTVGEVGGSFANRNHLALFLALGCLIAPVWPFLNARQPGWRIPVALGLLLLMLLTILATGSRAGLVLGAMGLGIGLLIARRHIVRATRRFPRRIVRIATASMIGLVVLLVLISFAAGRAVSINRLLSMDAGQDMRSRALPTVLQLVRDYFPAGSGFGGFDPIFRLHEPFGLLKLSYFNHAHNDFLEVVLDGGLPALLLLLAALSWWAVRSIQLWRMQQAPEVMLARLGSGMLLLIFLGSAFDYPARTPMMMATIVLAALWLSGGRIKGPVDALPRPGQHL